MFVVRTTHENQDCNRRSYTVISGYIYKNSESDFIMALFLSLLLFAVVDFSFFGNSIFIFSFFVAGKNISRYIGHYMFVFYT